MRSRPDAGRLAAGGTALVTVAGVAALLTFDVLLPASTLQDPIEGYGFLVAFLACATTGAVVLLRRPTHPVGWILAAVGIIPLGAAPLERWGTYVMLHRGVPDAATRLGFWLNSWYWYVLLALVLVYLPLFFPTGRLPSPRWRAAALVPTVALAVMVVVGMLQPTIGAQDAPITIPNPIGIAGIADPEESTLGSVLLAGLTFGMLLAIASVIVRFRRASGIERQQLKWFLAAAAALPTTFVIDALPVPEVVRQLAMPLTVAAMPVAIGVAVTRYRLYDLGRLVSRTVTYAIVIALLVGIYAASVLGLSAIARGVTGESGDLVVALSTLVVAAAFGPVTRRVRAAVDRRFNRSRYDAGRTVEAFGTRLRDELDLASLASQLHHVTARSVEPSFVSVWVRGGTS